MSGSDTYAAAVWVHPADAVRWIFRIGNDIAVANCYERMADTRLIIEAEQEPRELNRAIFFEPNMVT